MAITAVEGQVNLSGATTPAFTNSISGNGSAGSDLIIAFGIATGTNLGFSDNFNTGAYTMLTKITGNAYAGGGDIGIGYKVCNAGTNVGAGTFAVTGTGTGVARLQAGSFTGFTNTAQFPAVDIAKAVSSGSNANVNSGTFNTSVANEIIVSWVIDNSGFANPIGPGWAGPFPQGVQLNMQFLAPSLSNTPTLQSLGFTAGVAVTASDGTNPWVAFCFGFYDGTGFIPPPPVPSRGPMPKQIYIMP